MAKLLETENLGIAFGGLRALSDVTLASSFFRSL